MQILSAPKSHISSSARVNQEWGDSQYKPCWGKIPLQLCTCHTRKQVICFHSTKVGQPRTAVIDSPTPTARNWKAGRSHQSQAASKSSRQNSTRLQGLGIISILLLDDLSSLHPHLYRLSSEPSYLLLKRSTCLQPASSTSRIPEVQLPSYILSPLCPLQPKLAVFLLTQQCWPPGGSPCMSWGLHSIGQERLP